MLKIGDYVMWSGAWGSQSPKRVRVIGIELCEAPRQKYGMPINEVSWHEVNRCVFSLSNGHWAYGTQIDPLFNL